MAYAAVISLKQTINELLLSPSPASSSTRETLEFAYDQSTSLQKVLERFDDSSGRCSERLNDLEGQIRDVANQVEDALEFHGLNQSCSWEEVEHQITSFAETVKKMEVDYTEETSKAVVGCLVSSYTDFGVEMVGNSVEFKDIQDKLFRKMRPVDRWIMSFQGEVGSGRTHSARIFFEERLFECCAWVTVGKKYKIKSVMISILVQILENPAGESHYEMYNSLELCLILGMILMSRRYLIVLDDVHDEEVIHYLQMFSHDQGNGSLVIYTTSSERLSQMADMLDTFNRLKQIYEEMAWILLREVIFHGESITPEHVEYGKHIIEICPPGRISTAKMLLFLYKTMKSPDKWSKIAADNQIPNFMVEDEISEVDILRRELQSFRVMDDIRAGALAYLVLPYVESYENIISLKMMIQPERFFDKMQILSLWGMAGIGKSTLAKKNFKDEAIMHRFDHFVWVTLGQNYQSEEILIDILAQIYPSTDKTVIKGDEELARNLCAQLAGKRCFIVLDDLWSKDPLIRLKESFPDIMGTTLVTTRLAKVAKFGRDTFYEMKLLNKEESWCLLREKVFAQGLCSSELEKAGRKIAEKCEGLPLLILTVAAQLLKVEISEEYWNSVALGKEKSIFINAHDEISKGLLPSYERLAQHLKACFLYMGVFCNDYKIPTSKLKDLWILERFLEPNSSNANIVADLVDDSLVLGQRRVSDLQYKTCRLHPIFWHLSNTVVVTNKLFYAMNSYEDFSMESMKSQRRLCIRNNVLLGIKDVCNATKSSSKSRSLLCTGPPHQYPVSLYFGSRLLRVLDAVSIRWYEFPDEVVELIHLRYLSLTCNGRLPTSISKLLKLQHLIVNRYINTKSSENVSPLPVQIWGMKELIHLQVMGGILPNPKCGGDGLPNLSTLLDVSAESCTKKVLKRIPNLKRLSIQIELAPDEKGNPFRSLNRISQLRRLESLKCAVTNPHIRSDIALPAPISMFPSSLKELSLSGFGYPWEYMSTIGKLKNLQVLKLKQYAFRGPTWRTMGYLTAFAFSELKFLLVEDSDLVHWECNPSSFLKLRRVRIKHCYKLQEFPFGCRYEMLEIVDCSPLTVKWAENVKAIMRSKGEVEVHLSWIEEKRED